MLQPVSDFSSSLRMTNIPLMSVTCSLSIHRLTFGLLPPQTIEDNVAGNTANFARTAAPLPLPLLSTILPL